MFSQVANVANWIDDPTRLTLSDGRKLNVVFCHDVSPEDKSKMYKLVHDQFNCRECGRRAENYCKHSTKDGLSVFLPPHNVEKFSLSHFKDCVTDTDLKLYNDISSLACNLVKNPIVGLKIVNKSLYDYPRESGGFHHWTVHVPQSYMSSNFSNKEILKIESVFHRYLSELMPSLVTKITGESKENLNSSKESLLLMKECLNAATYGNKFIPALDWCLNIVNDLLSSEKSLHKMTDHEKWTFYATHLLLSPILEELHGAVCPFYHTVNNNILDLLGKANSKEEMIKLVESRLSPENYQRRDVNANINENEVKIAMTHLGDFTNTVMTFSEVCNLPHAVTVNKATSSLSGFNKMLDSLTECKNDAPFNFAKRCETSIEDKIKSIKTVDDLLEFVSQNPHVKVEIESESNNFVYISKTTLDSEKISVPHFWAYCDNKIHTPKWGNVTCILPMYKYITKYKNVAFICDNSKISPSGLGNCCFPEFLNSKYTRICGKAFERLNTTVPIATPDGTLAIGIGKSGKNQQGDVHIKLRINNTEIIINKLFKNP
jgi:hypothetical protein